VGERTAEVIPAVVVGKKSRGETFVCGGDAFGLGRSARSRDRREAPGALVSA